jgi:NAD(P)H-nitrite reductase large subunit
VRIVVIGSGIGGVTFAEKYRTLVNDAEIDLITRDNDGYYSRPLLSRGFSRDDIEKSIVLKTFKQLGESNINVIPNAEITSIDRVKKTISVTVNSQEKYLQYDILILAQGSAAFIPPPYRPYSEHFFCLNNLTDLKSMRNFRSQFLCKNQIPRWAIIGGGLIGCEVASDLAVAGDHVTLFHVMDRLMERQLVEDDSALLQKVLENSGVNVLLKQNVQRVNKHGDKLSMETDVISEFDALIVACGFRPRIELAQAANLETGLGIKVNGFLKTNDENIFALGDVAEMPNGKLFAFIVPIRNQALWLANYLSGNETAPWVPPVFSTKAKVHGFEAQHPYLL